MQPQPSGLSPDLRRLEENGYGFFLKQGHLFVSTPYVNAQREIKWGYFVSTLEFAGDQISSSDIHVAFFLGESVEDFPCDSEGDKLVALMNIPDQVNLGEGLTMTCSFSQRPNNTSEDFKSYYDKMTTHVAILLSEVHLIDSTVSFRDHPPMPSFDDKSPFRYVDSATTRARTGAVVDRIRGQKIAIIGLGGSGSYILDAVAKTPVAEIHLFDGDIMLTHNAFRAPGAATLEQLTARPLKVEHHRATYDAMHQHIVAHPDFITAENLGELDGFDFVFISMDASLDKLAIFEFLEQQGTPFVDTGMGIDQRDTSVAGIVRTSLSTPTQAVPAWINDEVSFNDEGGNDYAQNIQIAELNMLNAAFAVITWKKYFGFYVDYRHERASNYTIDGNSLSNEDPA